MRGSKSGLPLMALLDLLGRSWAMGVLWQLCDGGPATFRQLQGRCENVSPSVLNARLKDLRRGQLVERSDAGYAATQLGVGLFDLLKPLRPWAENWADALRE